MVQKTYFHENYEASRSFFREQLPLVQKYWLEAFLNKWYTGGANQNNSTDIITADATASKDKLLIITTGEHGIEGYPGSGALAMFIHEIIRYLHPETTGLRLVHSINPWGMRHNRRVTETNVDLNRNFQKNWDLLPSLAEEYDRLKEFFTAQPVESEQDLYQQLKEDYSFEELKKLKNTPEGQYNYKKGLYFGGEKMEETSQKLALSFTDWASAYKHILHIDLHTGGGPENELTMIFPDKESRTSEELEEDISFPGILKTEEAVELGDSTANLHDFLQRTYPQKKITSCLFEMGTVPENLEGLLFCTRTMMNENYAYFHGTGIDAAEKEIKQDFQRLFYPASVQWRNQYLRESYKAFLALLSSENFITSS